ncbi:PREDICTED: uncharacterized protein LOC107333984 [Acropora digitifera]|uniref:uncharacterized protein LOC107333984 n=1 Tax=Acropora digitifera TaxID=70779 RepID=UPI00077A0D37|nr:PREDICTED: uncharacterized protein LOC107333984 [Acropora digitifera]
MEIFLLTCTLMFRLFSAGSADSALFLDPPRFNIERTVNLETTVSCGRDMFQAERVLMCGLFANQGHSTNQDVSSRALDCSACDDEGDTQRSVTNILGANHTREWRSLIRAAGTYVHEINITITLPQVYLEHEVGKKNVKNEQNVLKKRDYENPLCEIFILAIVAV